MKTHPNPCSDLVCDQFPELKRLNYCHGQMLGAQDFVDEQSYYLNKIALLTRCLDGYGVVCGMTVHTFPDVENNLGKKDYQAPENGYQFRVDCGVAVDSRGRELVNRDREKLISIPYRDGLSQDNDNVEVNPYRHGDWCSESDRQKFQKMREGSNGKFDVWVTIQYHADLDGKQDLPGGGCCGDAVRSIQNRWNERPCIGFTFDGPPEQTCDSCCQPVEETRLWLARLTFRAAPNPILVTVDNTIRRHITTYETTRISGINWLHTGVYEENMAECLLKNGLTLEFTAPIDAQSLANHSVRLEGSETDTNELVEVAISDELEISKNNPLQILQASITPHYTTKTLPNGDEIQECRKLTVNVKSSNLSPPQRVLITVRTEFMLDTCCRAIDGCNLGGATRYVGWNHVGITHPVETLKRTVAEYKGRFHSPVSCDQRDLIRPRTSGNGVPGSNFQSWFYVVGNECMKKYDQQPADQTTDQPTQ